MLLKDFNTDENITSLIGILVVSLLFASPYLLREYDIGVCTGNRVIYRNSTVIENYYEKRVKYLNQGDIVLIKSKAAQPLNDNYFEAVASKNLLLKSVDGNSNLPTYIIPEQMSCRISVNRTNDIPTYYIELTSYERDGALKKYANYNLPPTSFVRAELVPKHHVISKHGNQILKTRFIGISKNDSLNWYFGVLTLYLQYISNIFNELYLKHYNIDDNRIGFDNFQPVTDILQVQN